MSITIHAPKDPTDVSSVIHHLPCHIVHTGKANVSDFFLPTVHKAKVEEGENIGHLDPDSESSDHHHYTAAFRGRPLNGKRFNLGPDYTGLVLEESRSKEKASLVKSISEKLPDWKVVAKFDSLTYWNWDKTPSDADGVQQLLQWTQIANAAQQSARSFMPSCENFVDSDTDSN